jgi:esterase/lipase superfamily enzyme
VPGATFCFSWPSAGRLSSYLADEAAIEASFPFLREYIDLLLLNTGEVPLNIIVHSMGNRAIVDFLKRVSNGGCEAYRNRIKSVILAAPDIDSDVFKQDAAEFLTVPNRTTLYAARADIALLGSGWLHEYGRAGLAPSVITESLMDTVLVEDFNLVTLGHSYVAKAGPLLHDMFNILQYDCPPDRRPALLAATNNTGEKYWKLSLL